MRIDPKDIRVGDILVFKGKGPFYEVLSRILKVAEILTNSPYKKWDRFGWHQAVVTAVDEWDIYITEAIAPVVKERPLTVWGKHPFRAYRWLKKEPEADKVKAWRADVVGRPYDVLAYVLTVLFYILRQLTGYHGRLSDNTYQCWEIVSFFADYFGKPLEDADEYPLISRTVIKLESEPVK